MINVQHLLIGINGLIEITQPVLGVSVIIQCLSFDLGIFFEFFQGFFIFLIGFFVLLQLIERIPYIVMNQNS